MPLATEKKMKKKFCLRKNYERRRKEIGSRKDRIGQ
jgi:hypothetical protein